MTEIKLLSVNLINEIASECFMPLSYGGGINNLNQMEKILSCGVEKIIINNSLNNTNLIKEAEKIFGSQFLVASIDIKKNIFGKYCIYDYLNKKIISKNIKQYNFKKSVCICSNGISSFSKWIIRIHKSN